MEVEAGHGGVAGAVGVANGGVSTQSVGEGSSIEQEVGEDTVTKTPELLGGLKIEAGLLVEESASFSKENGVSDMKDTQTGNAAAAEEKETPHNVSGAQAAGETGHLVNNGKDRNTTKESDEEVEEEEVEEEEDEDDSDQEEGMVEDDSEPLVESDEDSSDTSSENEEDESSKTASQTQHKDGAKELEKMVRVEKEGSSDDEDGTAEPPRTVNEITVLPPVPQIEAVLGPHQTPHAVGVISSVLDKQVIVEAVEHKMVLNEGSILWLTEQRVPLGLVDEVFGPVKKPYYVVRYNKISDIPNGASHGVTVGFVQEFASFVLNEADLRRKGYDASGQHDEEISDEEVEFSDDEKEEEAKRMRKQAMKRGFPVREGFDGEKSGGRGGRGGGRGGRNGRGRGGGRGRLSRSDSASMPEGADTAIARIAGMGLQRSNSQGSHMYHRDKGPGGEQQPRGQFQASPDRRDSWSRSPRHDMSYSPVPEPRPPMVSYNERQPLAYQSPHHDFVPGMRPLQQQQQHLSPQRPAAPPQWGPSPSGPIHHIDVSTAPRQAAPYSSTGRWHPAGGLAPDSGVHHSAGGFQHPEPMYQTIVGVLPAASYPHAQQVGMYAPPPQRVGTGVFIPPPQYSRSTLVNQNQMHGPGHLNQMQGSGHPGTDGRGPVGQWQLSSPSIVTGIPCYSGPAAPVYLQPGTVLNPGMSVPAPSNNVYWSNTSGR